MKAGVRVCLGTQILAGKKQKTSEKRIIMFPKSIVTQANESTEAAEVRGSCNEPASRTNESGQQRNDDKQKWDWIHHCDEVISNLLIGLT